MPTRAHVILPEELIAEIGRVAGQRRRSRFVEQAIREKLAKVQMVDALERAAGSVDTREYPHGGRASGVAVMLARGLC